MAEEDQEAEEVMAKVGAMVQSIVTDLLKSDFGPLSSAFVLGVSLSAVISLMKTKNPKHDAENITDSVYKAFLKGYAAETVPIIIP